ncbi:MAG: hypothetical protein K8R21_00295 [Leptospira sp.]|nr:hypothetical protein [Leptospira sp.]
MQKHEIKKEQIKSKNIHVVTIPKLLRFQALSILLPCLFFFIYCGSNTKEIQEKYTEALKLFEQKDLENSKKKFEELVDSDGVGSNAETMIGKINYYNRKFDQAEENFKKAYNKEPANLNALLWLVKIQTLKKDHLDEALKNINVLIEHDSSNIEGWYFRGVILEEMKIIPEAIRSYRLAIQESKKVAQVHLRLGMIYKRARMTEQADKEFELAESAGADDKSILTQIEMAKKIKEK